MPVAKLRTTERMNEPFVAVVELMDPVTGLDDRGLLGRSATLSIQGSNDGERSVHGIVTRVANRAGRGRRFRIEPQLIRLKQSAGWRIFHGMTCLDVAAKVLLEHGVVFRRRIRDTYDARPHITQRGESDFDFVTRILADEGIFWFFDHPREVSRDPDATNAGTGEVLVLCDHAEGYARMIGTGPVRFRASHGDVQPGDDRVVLGMSSEMRLESEHVVVLGREFSAPALPVRSDHGGLLLPELLERFALPPVRTGLIYEHDANLEGMPLRSGTAEKRLEARRKRCDIARAETPSPHLVPGRTFEVDEAPTPALNRQYVVTECRQRGDIHGEKRGVAFMARLCLTSAKTAFRPDRKARQRVLGLETATVTGPPGSEIHTDIHGRVQVRFHWDLEAGDPVAWLRVTHAWAGAGFGGNWLPRVGNEVLVGYIDGDPDRPIVVGSMHHPLSPAVVRYPEAAQQLGFRTRSTPGGAGYHEIIFDDKAGQERLSMRSQRDLAVESLGDAAFTHRGDVKHVAGRDRQDAVGGDWKRVTDRNAHEEVRGDRQSVVAGSEMTAISGDVRRHVVGDSYERIDGPLVTVELRGTRRTMVGTGEEGGSDIVSATRDYRVAAGKTIELSGHDGLIMQCGSSSIRVTENEIVLDAPKIALRGTERTRIHHGPDGEVVFSFDGSLGVLADEVTVASKAGGMLRLDADAKLDGAFVKLNCGESNAGMSRDGDDPSRPADAVFKLDPRGLPGGPGKYTMIIGTPDGRRIEKDVEPGGEARVTGRPGDKFFLVEVRRDGVPIGMRKKRGA